MYIYIYIHTKTYINIPTHIHTYIRTYIHTYIHTCLVYVIQVLAVTLQYENACAAWRHLPERSVDYSLGIGYRVYLDPKSM